MDIAYKLDESIKGLPLGWVDVYGLDAELATTSIEDPDTVVSVVGHLAIPIALTELHLFNPRQHEHQQAYIKPGVSGSPLIYQNHIIGILPARVASGSTHDDLPAMQAMAVVFNGEPMKQKMEEFGLPLPSEPLVSGLLR